MNLNPVNGGTAAQASYCRKRARQRLATQEGCSFSYPMPLCLDPLLKYIKMTMKQRIPPAFAAGNVQHVPAGSTRNRWV